MNPSLIRNTNANENWNKRGEPFWEVIVSVIEVHVLRQDPRHDI